MRTAGTFLLCALAVSLPQCKESEPPPPQFQPETVLVVSMGAEAVEVSAEEVKRAASKVRFARANAAELHYRRLALREIVLPRAAIRAANSADREEARTLALTLESELVDGTPHEAEIVSTGDLNRFGPLVIGTMLELKLGEWSELLENVGCFQFVRAVEFATQEKPFATLAIVTVPYGTQLSNYEDVERYLDQSVLTVVDTGYGDLVPTRIKHLMGPEAE